MQVQRHESEYDYYDRRPSDLQPLKRLDDWQIAEGEPDVRGYEVVDRSGDKIGKIDDLLVSPEARQAVFAVISYGDVLGIGGKHTLMPLDKLDFDTERHRGIFESRLQDLRDAPQYTDDTRDYGPFYDFYSGRHEEAERVPMAEGTEHPQVGRREEQLGELEAHRERVVKRTKLHVFRREVEPREVRPGEQVIREGEEVRIPIAEQRPGARQAEVTGEIIVQPETIEEEEEEEEHAHHRTM